jgi:hypothetical protein
MALFDVRSQRYSFSWFVRFATLEKLYPPTNVGGAVAAVFRRTKTGVHGSS